VLTKTSVTDDEIAAVLRPLGVVERVEPLSGGMFASVVGVDLVPAGSGAVPRRVVVKVTGADTSRLLRYEHGILGTEEAVYRLAHAAGLPVPRVLHADFSRELLDGDALVATFVEGTAWSALDLAPDEAAGVRRELGAFMARLHAITGDRFGYPAPASGLAAPTWVEAYDRMLGAVLADAVDWGVDLPAGRVRDAVARHRGTLAEVTVPRLVHADLWPGNVLLDADRRIAGVLDAERALWGDPLVELVGCDQHGVGAVDPDVLAGYRAAGGDLGVGDGTPDDGDASAWTRLRLYRLYLACVLTVEVVPRAYEGDWVAGYEATARANLDRVLDELGA